METVNKVKSQINVSTVISVAVALIGTGALIYGLSRFGKTGQLIAAVAKGGK